MLQAFGHYNQPVSRLETHSAIFSRDTWIGGREVAFLQERYRRYLRCRRSCFPGPGRV